jgi:hypothetical protein
VLLAPSPDRLDSPRCPSPRRATLSEEAKRARQQSRRYARPFRRSMPACGPRPSEERGARGSVPATRSRRGPVDRPVRNAASAARRRHFRSGREPRRGWPSRDRGHEGTPRRRPLRPAPVFNYAEGGAPSR